MPQINPEQVARLIDLVSDKRCAAREVKVQEAAARTAVLKYKRTESTAYKVGSGRSRKASPR